MSLSLPLGFGFGRDERKAVELLRKAAAGNFPDAFLTLAHAYSTGRGVGQAEPQKAYCWFSLLRRTSSVEKYQRWAEQYRRAHAASGTADLRPEKPVDCLDGTGEIVAQ